MKKTMKQTKPKSDLTDRKRAEEALSASRAQRIRRAFTIYPCPMDIVVYTPAEMKYWAATPTSLAATVLREGKILYKRN